MAAGKTGKCFVTFMLNKTKQIHAFFHAHISCNSSFLIVGRRYWVVPYRLSEFCECAQSSCHTRSPPDTVSTLLRLQLLWSCCNFVGLELLKCILQISPPRSCLPRNNWRELRLGLGMVGPCYQKLQPWRRQGVHLEMPCPAHSKFQFGKDSVITSSGICACQWHDPKIREISRY